MEKDLSNLIKYKDELSKEALKSFIDHLQKDIKTLKRKIYCKRGSLQMWKIHERHYKI